MVPLHHLPESYMTSSRVRKTRTVKQKLCLVASQLLLRKRGETLYGVLKKKCEPRSCDLLQRAEGACYSLN